jgi:hypothetical protein
MRVFPDPALGKKAIQIFPCHGDTLISSFSLLMLRYPKQNKFPGTVLISLSCFLDHLWIHTPAPPPKPGVEAILNIWEWQRAAQLAESPRGKETMITEH